MSSFTITDTVGSIVTRRPGLARVFERVGIDYCCGGKIPLVDACRTRGLDPHAVLAALEAAADVAGDDAVDAGAMTLTALADHIEATHHAYLKAELPRLEAMAAKVAAAHGDRDARLAQVDETCRGLVAELAAHMMKEERVLFPMVRSLEASATAPTSHCGSLANPIRVMEMEHDDAGAALARLRELTDGFRPPDWACNTYRALLDGFSHLERDLHQHVHKENNVLFPRAIAMEAHKVG